MMMMMSLGLMTHQSISVICIKMVSRVERKTMVNIFLKPLFRGNLDPFVNNANLRAIAHTSNGT